MKYRGKDYQKYGFRFTKKEAESLARSLRREYGSAIVKRDKIKKFDRTIYVVWFRKTK